MNGFIGFENLQIDCIIGVYPDERINEQAIFVSLKVKVDISICIDSDCAADTIDYVKLSQICIDTVKKNKFNLIETCASTVLTEIFHAFPVTWGWIKIKKPKAIPQSDGATIEIEKGIR